MARHPLNTQIPFEKRRLFRNFGVSGRAEAEHQHDVEVILAMALLERHRQARDPFIRKVLWGAWREAEQRCQRSDPGLHQYPEHWLCTFGKWGIATFPPIVNVLEAYRQMARAVVEMTIPLLRGVR